MSTTAHCTASSYTLLVVVVGVGVGVAVVLSIEIWSVGFRLVSNPRRLRGLKIVLMNGSGLRLEGWSIVWWSKYMRHWRNADESQCLAKSNSEW